MYGVARQPADPRAHAEAERRRRAAVPYHPTPAGFAQATMIEVPNGDGVATAPFTLWPEQARVLGLLAEKRLLIILKARQLGISWLACAYVLSEVTTKPGRTWLLYSQGQGEANELIRRIAFMYANHAERSRLPALVTENTTELEWSNRSRIISLPATRKAGRSFTASGVLLDEFAFMAWGKQLLDAVKPTVDGGGKLFIISTADGNGTPYHQQWQGAESGQTSYTAVFLPWQACPDRDPEWRQRRMMETQDPSSVLREYPENALEAFTHASGLVFDRWSDGPENGNVTESADYVPDAGPVVLAIDDGYVGSLDAKTGQYTANSHPRVFLLCQLRPNGQLCVFEESYAVSLLSEQHITDVLALPYPAPDYAVVDKSAAELKGRLHDAGIYTRNGANSVDESIKELRRWVAPDRNGVRRLLVHPRCKHLRSEFVSYRYDDKGNPVKAFDHGVDGIRYLCWNLRHET